MRMFLMAGAALMTMSGVALAQTATTGQSSTASHSKMKPAMKSNKHTMPTQRRSTVSKTMKKGSGSTQ